jgi:hypothetical protein
LLVRYIVEVSTPRHGRIFYAECYARAIVGVLEQAVRSIESIATDIQRDQLPLTFDVKVLP